MLQSSIEKHNKNLNETFLFEIIISIFIFRLYVFLHCSTNSPIPRSRISRSDSLLMCAKAPDVCMLLSEFAQYSWSEQRQITNQRNSEESFFHRYPLIRWEQQCLS